MRGAWHIAAVSILAACSTVQVDSDATQHFTLSGHDTFAWISDHPMVAYSPDVSPAAEDRIKQAIVEALLSKHIAYSSDPARATLLVAFTLTGMEKASVLQPGYPGPNWGMYPWVGSYYETTAVNQHRVGTLTINIFDVEGKQSVWHGWASKTVDEKPKSGEAAAKAVPKILANFPSGITVKN